MAIQSFEIPQCSQTPSQVACFQRFARAAAAEADAALLNGHTTQQAFLIGWDNRRVAARG
jgi:hypothetical protein